jgi:hypothetical protein
VYVVYLCEQLSSPWRGRCEHDSFPPQFIQCLEVQWWWWSPHYGCACRRLTVCIERHFRVVFVRWWGLGW